ncbi:phosphopantetheinyl transferase-like protein [Leptomonas pyrrhocoris]|uniref:holo-[acyl-carrier-protein] synthase n=1 Tax=Leptomonas pyrrhocoris TaxID=157538 RepID=A0A0N0DS16_LEPPY|nr:phosphopantetheinyl transferase-like protein [Leptomonas pyrrhocoris]KPA75314.1 phosphopantetheinyl transferase-like protein [Leptomonas pyrrhocoris]|eukprot:XP_015653753.1 phosphopantetheinyl transferase-like protein [Leptomonas pyrrhocoris]
MKVIIANAARWEPSREEFWDAVHTLHKNDLVRSAIEEAQRQMPPCDLQHHANLVKSRLLARHLLVNQLCHPAHSSCSTTAVNKAEVLLSTTVYGKPYTSFYKSGSFSVSHVSDWICCAYSAFYAVGVDIVAVQLEDHTFSQAILSKKELECVRQKDPPQRSVFLAVHWAVKECVLKALGLGISSHLQMSDISLCFDRDMGTFSITELVPEAATSTRALPVTVSLRDNSGERWMYSCVQIAGDSAHILAVTIRCEKCAENVEWQFESFQTVLRC